MKKITPILIIGLLFFSFCGTANASFSSEAECKTYYSAKSSAYGGGPGGSSYYDKMMQWCEQQNWNAVEITTIEIILPIVDNYYEINYINYLMQKQKFAKDLAENYADYAYETTDSNLEFLINANKINAIKAERLMPISNNEDVVRLINKNKNDLTIAKSATIIELDKFLNEAKVQKNNLILNYSVNITSLNEDYSVFAEYIKELKDIMENVTNSNFELMDISLGSFNESVNLMNSETDCKNKLGKNTIFDEKLNKCVCEPNYSFLQNTNECVRIENINLPSENNKLEFFSDIGLAHPQANAIKYLKQNGIINGYNDGSFKPENTVNRAELLKILIGTNLPSGTYENCFKDVKQEWFAPYTCYAKEQGWIQGYSDGTFRPAQTVNRAEAIKMAIEVFGLSLPITISSNPYSDVPKSQWYAKYIMVAKEAGLFDTMTSYKSGDGMQRGDISNIIYRLLTIKELGVAKYNNNLDDQMIKAENNTNFKNDEYSTTQELLDRAEKEMSNIEMYISKNNITAAKKSSKSAVDLTQIAYVNDPNTNVVLCAYKLAQAYDTLVDSLISGISKNNTQSKNEANKAIKLANDALLINPDISPIAKHIKDRAEEILKQVSN